MEDKFIELDGPIELMLFAIEELEKANHRLFFQELLACTRGLITLNNSIAEQYNSNPRYIPLFLSDPSPLKVRVTYNEADFNYIEDQLIGTNELIDEQLYHIEGKPKLYKEALKIMDGVGALATNFNLAFNLTGIYEKFTVHEKNKLKIHIKRLDPPLRNILSYQMDVEEYGIHDGYYQAEQKYTPISPSRYTNARIDEQGRGIRATRENTRFSNEGKFIKKDIRKKK